MAIYSFTEISGMLTKDRRLYIDFGLVQNTLMVVYAILLSALMVFIFLVLFKYSYYFPPEEIIPSPMNVPCIKKRALEGSLNCKNLKLNLP